MEGVLLCDVEALVEVVVEEVVISGAVTAPINVVRISMSLSKSILLQTVMRPSVAVDIVRKVADQQRRAKERSFRAIHLVGNSIGAHDESAAVAGVHRDPAASAAVVGQAFVVGGGVGGGNCR